MAIGLVEGGSRGPGAGLLIQSTDLPIAGSNPGVLGRRRSAGMIGIETLASERCHARPVPPDR